MKNLFCNLGIHDWYILDSISEPQIKANIKFQLENPNLPELSTRGACTVITIGHKQYAKKICLKCSRKVDDIATGYCLVRESILKEIELKINLRKNKV